LQDTNTRTRQKNTNKRDLKHYRMPSRNIIQYNKFRIEIRFQKKQSANKERKANKRSPSGRFLCSAGLFQSVVPPSVPQTTCHQKKEQLRKKSSSFFVVCAPSLHTVASCVRRGYYIRNTAAEPMPTLCRVCVCRPLFFQQLLFRPAIGVCSAIALHLNKER
jgi:hypothetical protein